MHGYISSDTKSRYLILHSTRFFMPTSFIGSVSDIYRHHGLKKITIEMLFLKLIPFSLPPLSISIYLSISLSISLSFSPITLCFTYPQSRKEASSWKFILNLDFKWKISKLVFLESEKSGWGMISSPRVNLYSSRWHVLRFRVNLDLYG